MKRFIIPLVFLSCLFWLVGSCSFANSLNTSGFETYNYNGDILDFFNQILKGATGYNFEDDNIPLGSSTNSSRWTTFLSNLSSDTYQYFSFSLQKRTGSSYGNQSSEYNTIYISYFSNTSTNGGYNGEIYLTTTSTPYITIGNLYNYSSTGIGITSEFNSITKSKFAINKNNSSIRANQLWYKATANTINITSSLKYISNKTTLFTVNSVNGSYTMYKADYNLNGYINIGYLTSYKSYNELQGYLAVFSGYANSDNSNYYDIIATFQYNKSNNTQYKNGLRLDYDTGQVYINSQVLAYDHAYSLYFTGNGEDTTTVALYYFVPFGSTATSGDINTDNPTGLDFDFINSINYISQLESGDVAYLVNDYLNSSGEPFGLNYISPDDSQTQYGFIHQVFNNVINTFLSDSDVTLNISVHSFEKVLRSSDFTTPNGPLKTFCALFLVVGTFMLLFQQITAIYLSVLVLDINKFLHSADVDFTFFM